MNGMNKNYNENNFPEDVFKAGEACGIIMGIVLTLGGVVGGHLLTKKIANHHNKENEVEEES